MFLNAKKAINLLLVVALFLTVTPMAAYAAEPPANREVKSLTLEGKQDSPSLGYVPGSVLVKFREGQSPVFNQAKQAFTLSSFQRMKHSNRPVVVPVPSNEDALLYAYKLSMDPAVEYAEPQYIYQLLYTVPPNDPDYTNSETWSTGGVNYSNAKSWWLRNQSMTTIWEDLNNSVSNYPPRAEGADIKVAVIDSGFYMNHPDKGSNILTGKDEFETYSNITGYTTDMDVTPVDITAPLNSISAAAHGTCVAGQISAGTNNSIGVAGSSYDTDVLVYKVQGIWVEGNPTAGYPAGCAVILSGAITNAIYDATDAGAKVISMSLGGTIYSAAIQNAIDYAYNNDVLVVAATGNNGLSNYVFYPAANNHVVGVGSYQLDATGNRVKSSFTNYGVGADASAPNNGQIDILAPGAMIWGFTKPDYDPDGSGTSYPMGYNFWQGTSMATPAFAADAALLWRFAPALSPDELMSYFYDSTDRTGAGSTPFPNLTHGYGYVDINEAYSDIKVDYPYLSATSFLGDDTVYTNADTYLIGWSAVSGTGVTYDLTAMRGAVPVVDTETASTLYSLNTSTEGTYELTIYPKSNYNWFLATNTDTKTIISDHTIPTISNLSWSGSPVVTWNDSEGTNPHTTRITIDSGIKETNFAGNSYTLPGDLSEGNHVVGIQVIDRAGNESVEETIGVEIIASPAAPSLADDDLYAPDMTYDWDDVSGANGYEWTFNSDKSGTTDISVSEITFSSLQDGANTLYVRSYNAAGYSSWSSATITYYPPLPEQPVLVLPEETVNLPLAVSWDAVDNASSYDYRINGGTIQNTTNTSFSVSSLWEGENMVEIRSKNYTGSSDWATEFTFYYPPENERLSGSDRYKTSVAISQEAFTSADNVVLVTGANWPDALGAGVLAKALDAPLLLTNTDYLNGSVETEIERLGTKKVYIVGGTASVSSEVANRLATLGISVERIAGRDRYTTSALIADKVYTINGDSIPDNTAFIASGEKFPDALSASPVAAYQGYPILLVKSTSIPSSISSQMNSMGITKTFVAGGAATISDSVKNSLPSATRLAGNDRYATAVAINNWAFNNTDITPTNIGVANGTKFSDALSGGPLMAGKVGVLMLVPYDRNSTFTNFYNTYDSEIKNTYILGGTASVSQNVYDWVNSR